MAKLDVVIPAVEVEVNGVKYRKVDRKAQAGDIIRIMECSRSYVTFGGFYTVDRVDGWGDARITDDDGNSYDTYGDKYDVYEKVASATKYSEVKRKANIGERIRIVDSCDTRYDNGDEFTVDSTSFMSAGVYVKHPEGTHNGCAGVLSSEYVVLEPVEQPKTPKPDRLNVGDYAKVINMDNIDGSDPDSSVKLGGIYEILIDDRTATPYRARNVVSGETVWFKSKRLARATEAEVEAYKKKAEVEAKWSSIGRKVNEFKAGDLTTLSGAEELGFAEVIRAEGDRLVVKWPSKPSYGECNDTAAHHSLVVPVEQRFDTKEAA